MSQILEPGQHLDADQLGTFVEHALPEHERLACVAHLAECSHCRQVVFLAQRAEQEIAPLPCPATTWWRWITSTPALSLATAALACALIVVVSIRLHHASHDPVRTTTAMADLPRTLPATSPVNKDSIALPNSLPVPEKPGPRDKAIRPDLKSMPPAPLFHTPQSATGGSVAGGEPLETLAAFPNLSKPTIQGTASNAPLAGSVNAVEEPLSTVQNNELRQQIHSSQSAFVTPSPPTLAAAQTSPMSATGGPISQPRSGNQTLEVTAGPAPIQTRDAKSYASFALGSAAHKAYRIPLPSNLPSVATVSNGRQTLAVDFSGALFLSSDAGLHWTPVVQQWLGKAVHLSLAIPAPPPPAPTKRTAADLGATAGQLSKSQSSNIARSASAPLPAISSGFQLTTDLGAVWTSQDGLTWTTR